MATLESKARQRSRKSKAEHECEQSAKKLFRQEKMKAGLKITAVKVKAQAVKIRGQVAQQRIGEGTKKTTKGITTAKASALKGFAAAKAEFKSLKSLK